MSKRAIGKRGNFADCAILGYTMYKPAELVVHIELFDESTTFVVFTNVYCLRDTRADRITELVEETDGGELLAAALRGWGDNPPRKHGFRLFQFISEIDDLPSLEIVAQEVVFVCSRTSPTP